MKAEAVLCAAVSCMLLAAGCRGPGRKQGRGEPAGPAGSAERRGTSADTRVSESVEVPSKGAPEAAVAWGEAVNGVRYGLSCNGRSFESGRPISLTVHVENVGETTVTIFDPAQPSYGYLWRLIFTPSDGGVPFIAMDHAHVRWEFRETRLAPGETKTGRIEIDSALLPDTLHIRRGTSGGFVRELPPGRYRAVAEEPGGKFTTGAVEIEVAAKGEAAAGSGRTSAVSIDRALVTPQLVDVPGAGYRIAATPVTNAQYRQFLRATGRRWPVVEIPEHARGKGKDRDYPWTSLLWDGDRFPEGRGDYPVALVTRTQAEAYCRWLSDVLGRTYTLPPKSVFKKATEGARSVDVGRRELARSGHGWSIEGTHRMWFPLAPVRRYPELRSRAGCHVQGQSFHEWIANGAARPNAWRSMDAQQNENARFLFEMHGPGSRLCVLGFRVGTRWTGRAAGTPTPASSVRFLMVPPDGEKRSGLYATWLRKGAKYHYPSIFQNAADRKAELPRAGIPVTLVGKLPGQAFALDFFEAREGSITGTDIELPARFVECMVPFDGPAAPRDVYVVAHLPPLEAGRYRARITFEQFQYLDLRDRTKIERVPPGRPPRFAPLTCEFEVKAKAASALRLTISADAKELTTTHLPIQATFENVSDRAVKILKRSVDKRNLHIWFWLRMTSDSGTRVRGIRRGGKIQLRGTLDYVTLRPGGAYSVSIDAATLTPVLKAGEYTLKLTYVNQYGRDCFRGRLESNTINVSLTGPAAVALDTKRVAIQRVPVGLGRDLRKLPRIVVGQPGRLKGLLDTYP